jgi:hypothetical protein
MAIAVRRLLDRLTAVWSAVRRFRTMPAAEVRCTVFTRAARWPFAEGA